MSTSTSVTRENNILGDACRLTPHRGCLHCGTKVLGSSAFCCQGCEFVFGLLEKSGLSQYYDLRSASANSISFRPIVAGSDQYSYLDDPEFLKEFSIDNDYRRMDFYLEGIQCVACLWLIEKLPVLVDGVISAELDFGRSTVSVHMSDTGQFSLVAQTLDRLGYRPHPIQKDSDSERFLQKENRVWLVRMGVAGACTGNIMLLAVSIYGGVQGYWEEVFRWVSLALFLPVATFCAIPFYKSALSALRGRALSIDVPISMAIILGSVVSVVHTIQGSDHVYYDSLAALVFLLLATRYLLRRIQQSAMGRVHLLRFLAPASARLWNAATSSTREILTKLLKSGDIIAVDTDCSVPVDGVVVSGQSAVNNSLLTGESFPQKVAMGDEVFAGTLNEGERILVKVESTGINTRLGKILDELENRTQKKAPIVEAADRFSQWFLWTVLLSATAVLIFTPHFADGLNRALAMMIVTCPCALALATPLTMSLSLQRAASAGILIKDPTTIERLSQLKSVVLDKTGTITTGHFEVTSWINNSKDAESFQFLKKVFLGLESRSKHPIAKSIVRNLKNEGIENSVEIAEWKESIGSGVKGKVNGQHFEVKAVIDASQSGGITTRVGLFRNQDCLLIAELSDKVREDTFQTLKSLNDLSLEISILSGDSQQVVDVIQSELQPYVAEALGSKDPLMKKEYIKKKHLSLMVGDGANDALALAVAPVSAAVHGSMEVSLRAADVYLSTPGIQPVYDLIVLSRKSMATIYRNFGFSLFYNLVGGIAAATGHITPLMAAVLMPLSAFTVFVSSLVGARKLVRS